MPEPAIEVWPSRKLVISGGLQVVLALATRLSGPLKVRG